MDQSGVDWEDAFQNRACIPDAERYPSLWAARASAFREATAGELDIPYGAHARERFDLFRPAGSSKGLAVFVHGGFWLRFDKSSWSHLAGGAVARGWTAALPSYGLAPEVRISAITGQIAAAIQEMAGRVEGPLRLAGHSAGGHLVTRMICDDTPLPKDVAERIERVVSISGLHDLRPLRLNSMNDSLRLDESQAASESACRHDPRPGHELIAWVGGGERPEFLRQSALLVEAWRGKCAAARLVVEADRHHFDVIEGLADPEQPLTEAFVGS